MLGIPLLLFSSFHGFSCLFALTHIPCFVLKASPSEFFLSIPGHILGFGSINACSPGAKGELQGQEQGTGGREEVRGSARTGLQGWELLGCMMAFLGKRCKAESWGYPNQA